MISRFFGYTYGFLLGKFVTLTLKRETNFTNYITVSSTDVWQSYFNHSFCQIHFTLFWYEFTFVAIYEFFFK